MATSTLIQNGTANRLAMDASKASSADVCPICKSTLQTSPNLRFKVAARCYHRICEGCVDRKFSAGKAQCPVSGCDKMLWKRDWKIQTYEDVQVMREVDIRRSVANTLDLAKLGLIEGVNGWEDCFEDLRAYNNFLEDKEEYAMNLIYGTDVVKTKRRLEEFKQANGFAKENDGRVVNKNNSKLDGYPDASGLIKGLKKKVKPKARSPYNAFAGVDKDRGYYQPLTYQYDRAGTVSSHGPGGYSFSAYVDESLFRAFSGLGLFIGEEKKSRMA